MSNPILSVQNLSVSFGSHKDHKEVVKGFSLDLFPGQILGVVGESGSGKSVSCMSLVRLIGNAKLSADKMIFRHTDESTLDLLTATEEELQSIRGKNISYIFQEPMSALHPLYTCGEQIVEGIRVHRDMSKKNAYQLAEELFAEMSLPDPQGMLHRYPHQLSGGQRQRVMMAMAMSNDPDIIIADEPTTALDSILQTELTQKMVDGCTKRNAGLILISHDIQLVKDFTEEVIVMYNGEIMEAGKTLEVTANPNSIYTRSLLMCQPSYEKKSQVLPTISELTKIEQNDKLNSFRPNTFEFQAIDRTTPILSIKHVTKKFYQKIQETIAVNDVSLNIFKGETVGLVGESGCGKSTLSKMIIGLLDCDEGTIEIGGFQKNKDARKVQMIFQDPYSSLNPAQKVEDILGEVILVHGLASNKKERKERVADLLQEVGLSTPDMHKYPHEFSGGQRQRISIARALAVEPELIICDESVSALDISVQAQILNLFNELKVRHQLTYLFISHDMNVVTYLCDRIAIMKNGSLIETEDTSTIMTQPKSEYTRLLLQKTIR